MGIFWGLGSTPFSIGFNNGLFSGFLFGTTMGLFMFFLKKKPIDIPKEIEKEGVIAFGQAGNIKNSEVRGGNLFLTKRGLHWISHGLNFQNESIIIESIQINNFGSFSRFSFIPDGLFVELLSGLRISFAVSNRDEWLTEIHKITGKKINSNHVHFENSKDLKTENTTNSDQRDVNYGDKIKILEELYELKNSGALSEEEFQAEKKKILSK